jgi:hypothetical protein
LGKYTLFLNSKGRRKQTRGRKEMNQVDKEKQKEIHVILILLFDSDFFPVVFGFLKRLPIIGPILSHPAIARVRVNVSTNQLGTNALLFYYIVCPKRKPYQSVNSLFIIITCYYLLLLLLLSHSELYICILLLILFAYCYILDRNKEHTHTHTRKEEKNKKKNNALLINPDIFSKNGIITCHCGRWFYILVQEVMDIRNKIETKRKRI